MKKLYLLFLWHMHQPWYINPRSGLFEMPWVFLHSIKDYYDMPWILSKYNLKATFNLVPSLIKQLEIYIESPDKCYLLKTLKKEVSILLDEEKKYLLNILFSSNLENMIKPFSRYYHLFLLHHKKQLNNEELLDLQVLFLLSWTGNFLRENNKIIKKLIEKEQNFTQEEKLDLINILINFLKEIVQFYKKLQKEEKIEISTTPFYHPIMPLLLNTESAKEANPQTNLPRINTKFGKDADIHIQKSIDFYKSTFKTLPKGIWPSEGSVSNDVLNLLKDFNIKWTATDEQILFNSLGNKNLKDVYKIYNFHGLYIFFRDKFLSDSIGFRYQNLKEEDSVKDFILRLKHIYDICDFNPVVSVILDGENAWEFYKNNGKDFFNLLYSTIEKEGWIECLTFSEVLERDVIIENINSMKPGSWINGNLNTWVGHPEKNTAWEYLSYTKNIAELEKEKKPDKYNKAIEHLLIAEGSDWFWWYGDDHFSNFADKFDLLFRLNLQEVYKTFNKTIPTYLTKPIKKTYKKAILKKPKQYIKPIIDGKISNYFEWLNAGEIDLTFDISSMDIKSLLTKALYGYDKENLYLLIFMSDSMKDLIRCSTNCSKIKLKSIFISSKEVSIDFDFDSNLEHKKDEIEGKIGNVIEIKIPFSIIEAKSFDLHFEVYKDLEMLQRIPIYDLINLDLSENFDYNWIV